MKDCIITTASAYATKFWKNHKWPVFFKLPQEDLRAIMARFYAIRTNNPRSSIHALFNHKCICLWSTKKLNSGSLIQVPAMNFEVERKRQCTTATKNSESTRTLHFISFKIWTYYRRALNDFGSSKWLVSNSDRCHWRALYSHQCQLLKCSAWSHCFYPLWTCIGYQYLTYMDCM